VSRGAPVVAVVLAVSASSFIAARGAPPPRARAAALADSLSSRGSSISARGAPPPRARAAALADSLSSRGPFISAREAPPPRAFQAPGLPASPASAQLVSDLDRIFADPVLTRALIGVRVESLDGGGATLVYARNSDKLVMPASNMKLLTMSAAADRLGWDFKYETQLEATGPIDDGTLHGDLIVTGGGDPSISSQDFGPSPLFEEWATKLSEAGVRRVDGRLIGDDNFFDDEGLGAGWAWDYLSAGYAAPSGALSYNENVAVVRAWPGKTSGEAVKVEVSPPGHLLEVRNELTTGAAGSATNIDLLRLPGSPHLTIRGSVPAGGSVIVRTAAIDNPTRFFVEGLRLALAARGINVRGGAWDIDDVAEPPAASGRRPIARRESLPLSALAGYFLKVSQNFYGETILKTLGRAAGGPGTTDAGRKVVRDTLVSWGVPADSFVMYDGSGLSRYNYVTAGTIVSILEHVWHDERLRGPFLAALPVAGHDGTLDTRMKGTVLDARVQAKTGTISNVRSLSGFLETKSGERLVFSMIANHFTAPSAQIDAVVERALARLADR
jgi:D-alanyl-D-alanine carboxypeptidase/D-alanyl-D-alanine-endopeptidase (penicillin-binding protein 4)